MATTESPHRPAPPPRAAESYPLRLLSRETLLGLPLLTLAAAVYLALLGPWYFTSRSIADVGIIANGAARILAGQAPYRDFFLFLGPVGPYLTALWLVLCGPSALSLIGLTVALAVVTAWATYGMVRLLAPPPVAAVAMLGFLAVGPFFWFALNHHWFGTFFLALACLAAMLGNARRSTRLLVLAGALVALAGLSHQPRGVVGLLVLLFSSATTWPGARRPRALLAGLAGTAGMGAIWLGALVVVAGPLPLVQDLVLFPLTQYPKANAVGYLAFDFVPVGFRLAPPLDAAQACLAWGAYAVGPLCLLWLALSGLRRGLRADDRQARGAWTFALFGLAAWLGVLYRPTALSLAVSPWLAAGLALILYRGCRATRPRARYAWRLATAGLAALWLVFLPIPHAAAILTGQVVWTAAPTGAVPLGTAADADLSGAFPEVAAFLAAQSDVGDPVLFYPYRSVNNVLLLRPNPTRLDFIFAGENTDAQLREVVRRVTIEHAARYVVIEKGPAERNAEWAAEVGITQAGEQALAELRARLPLVLDTPQVEIRAVPR